MSKGLRRSTSVTAIICGLTAATVPFAPADAQDNRPSYSMFGTPGLLEMPTAESADQGEIGATLSYTGNTSRAAVSFQLTDRLSGTFRYSGFDLYLRDTNRITDTFDRSFDLQYRLTDESTYLPALAVGLRDFLGTGRYSSEYIVASKSVGPNLIVSGGLGWGRMATNGGFENPLGFIGGFDTRPDYEERNPDGTGGEGGQLSTNQWFHGDAAFFAGLEYQMNEKLGFKAEYSSMGYPTESFEIVQDVRSPLNFGVTYRPSPGYELGLSYLYGTEIGVSATMVLNPNDRPGLSGTDRAPAPVRVRPADARAALTWDRTVEPPMRAALSQLLELEGLELVSLEVTDRTARLRYNNNRYRAEAQAMGRAARMMSQVIPPSVESFTLEPMRRGVPISATTIARSDLESLENRPGNTQAILDRAVFADAGGDGGLVAADATSPRFEWGVGPYLSLLLFDASGPINADVGLQFDARYEIQPNLVVSGQVRQSLLGARDPGAISPSSPNYQNVRSDGARYGIDGGPVLENLTLSYFGRPGQDLYSRVSAGYFERMFGGVSTELLWKPVESRLGLGAELNYAMQRDSDMGLGFGEYDYSVVTGHLSAYYDLGNGFQTQVDVGRYLAGDWGATVTLDREFENGWRVGAYFTLTDMPFEDFGEGSFDKGIRVTVPNDFFFGTPTRKRVSTTLASLSRDGGARLNVDGRLYETVREGHLGDLSDGFGRFWR